MKLGSLCSGAAGLDRSVEQVFGATTVWHAETDLAASKVLAHHWPGVPNHGDLTTVDWGAVELVDIMCAGWPCQPWSAAGKQLGAADERAIWPNIADAVRVLRPGFVCLENVPTVIRLGELWRVANDLAALGYDLRWTCLRASDVGAPHRRERVFIVASRTAAHTGHMPGRPEQPVEYHEQTGRVGQSGEGDAAAGRHEPAAGRSAAADAAGERRPWGDEPQPHMVVDGPQPAHVRSGRTATDSPRVGRHQGRPEPARLVGGFDAAVGGAGPVDLLPTPCAQQSGNTPENHLGKKPGRTVVTDLAILVENGLLETGGALLPTPNVADGMGGHLNRSGDRKGELLLPGVARAYGNGDLLPTPTSRDHKGEANKPGRTRDGRPRTAGDDSLPDAVGALLPTPRTSDTNGAGVHGEGGMDLRTAVAQHQWGKYAPAIARWESLTRPAPTPTEPNRNGKPRLNPAFSEWMMGWPAGWVTAVPGISRNDQLRIIGNGVVTDCATAALTHLLTLEIAA